MFYSFCSWRFTRIFAFPLLSQAEKKLKKFIPYTEWFTMQAKQKQTFICDWNHILRIFSVFCCWKFKSVPVLCAYVNCTCILTVRWQWHSIESILSVFFHLLFFVPPKRVFSRLFKHWIELSLLDSKLSLFFLKIDLFNECLDSIKLTFSSVYFDDWKNHGLFEILPNWQTF